MSDNNDALLKLAKKYAEERDSDVMVYIGGINMSSARTLVDQVCQRQKRTNLFFILGTNGGDAHAGYKIARCLQHAYEKGEFSIAAFGDCKSAGTLVAIARKMYHLGHARRTGAAGRSIT